jgi:hypothetical protein
VRGDVDAVLSLRSRVGLAFEGGTGYPPESQVSVDFSTGRPLLALSTGRGIHAAQALILSFAIGGLDRFGDGTIGPRFHLLM